MEDTIAVSELISSILLISLVSLAIGIIGSHLINPNVTKIPRVEAIVERNLDNCSLSIQNVGGDAVSGSELEVRINGVNVTKSVPNGNWTNGAIITVPKDKIPANSGSVSVIYTGLGSNTVIVQSIIAGC